MTGKSAGLVVFDGQTWSRVVKADPWPLVHLLRGVDAIYAVDSQNAIHRLDNGTLEPFAPRPSQRAEARYTVDEAGRIWAVAGQTVGLWSAEEKKWVGKPIPKAQGKDHSLVDEIAVVGTPPVVWVAGMTFNVDGDRITEEDDGVLFARVGDEWSQHVLQVKPGATHWTLASSPHGRAYANTGMNLFELREAGPRPIELNLGEPRLLHSDTAVSSDGHLLVASRDRADRPCWLARFDPTSDAVWTSDGVEFACQGFQRIALDDAHRAWVVSEAGVAVIPTDHPKPNVREYLAASIPALQGTVTATMVVDAGPADP